MLQDRRIVQYILLLESDQYNMILYRRVVQYIIILKFGGLSTLLQDRSMSNGFSKTKSFCFESRFSYMALACVRESVRTRDIRHGM